MAEVYETLQLSTCKQKLIACFFVVLLFGHSFLVWILGPTVHQYLHKNKYDTRQLANNISDVYANEFKL